MSANRQYCKDVPVLLEVEPMVDHFREHGKPTIDALSTALGRVGRDNGPQLLFNLWDEGLLTRWTLTRFVGEVWKACDHPEAEVAEELWLLAFEQAGYTVDGRRAEYPDTPLILYRGASFERRLGMSWTDDVNVARWFASKWNDAKGYPGIVWTATVESWRLLARNTDTPDGEPEYIIDTFGLALAEYTPVEASS